MVKGDKRVADIYFTEFLRIYTHHAFRESLSFKQKPGQELPRRVTEVAETVFHER